MADAHPHAYMSGCSESPQASARAARGIITLNRADEDRVYLPDACYRSTNGTGTHARHPAIARTRTRSRRRRARASNAAVWVPPTVTWGDGTVSTSDALGTSSVTAFCTEEVIAGDRTCKAAAADCEGEWRDETPASIEDWYGKTADLGSDCSKFRDLSIDEDPTTRWDMYDCGAPFASGWNEPYGHYVIFKLAAPRTVTLMGISAADSVHSIGVNPKKLTWRSGGTIDTCTAIVTQDRITNANLASATEMQSIAWPTGTGVPSNTNVEYMAFASLPDPSGRAPPSRAAGRSRAHGEILVRERKHGLCGRTDVRHQGRRRGRLAQLRRGELRQHRRRHAGSAS